VQDDAVRGHPAADLVLVKGCDEPYLLLDILVQGIQDQFPFLPADGVQDLHRIIRLHLGDDLARLSGADLFQAFPCLFLLQVGERLCQHLRRTDAEHLFPFLLAELFDHIRNVAAVIILQLIQHGFRRSVPPDNAEDLALIVGLFCCFCQYHCLFHWNHPFLRSVSRIHDSRDRHRTNGGRAARSQRKQKCPVRQQVRQGRKDSVPKRLCQKRQQTQPSVPFLICRTPPSSV